MATKDKKRQRIASLHRYRNLDETIMCRCRRLGFPHKYVNSKRKKEAKKENHSSNNSFIINYKTNLNDDAVGPGLMEMESK
jgi:hypothetical protein